MPKPNTTRKASANSTEEVTLVRARDVLGELVDRALYEGECTLITRRGRQAAAVIPIALYKKLIGQAA